MSDVRLYAAPDGGEIDFVAGAAVMADGLESAVYLSLFGGNQGDGGGQADDAKQWWGNLGETDPAKTYRSETQALLRSLPLVPANLRRIEDAVGRDLAWMTDSKIATGIAAQASLPAINTVKVSVFIEIDGKRYPFSFVQAGKTS